MRSITFSCLPIKHEVTAEENNVLINQVHNIIYLGAPLTKCFETKVNPLLQLWSLSACVDLQ